MPRTWINHFYILQLRIQRRKVRLCQVKQLLKAVNHKVALLVTVDVNCALYQFLLGGSLYLAPVSQPRKLPKLA